MGRPGSLTVRTCHVRLLTLMVVATLTLSACLPREAGPPGTAAQPTDATTSSGPRQTTDPGRWPLSFVANRGQLDAQVGYYVPGQNATTYFTSSGLIYAIEPGGFFHATRDSLD